MEKETIDKIEAQLGEIIITSSMNAFTISRYVAKVPLLIDSHITKREIENEKKKFKKKHDDLHLIKLSKDIYNGIVTFGSSTDKIYLPNYFNSSSLLLVFAMLEDTSRELGKIAKEITGSKLSLKNINEPNSVKKVKTYLEKHIGIDLSEINSAWGKIIMYNQVRNCIIHHNSKVNDNAKEGLKRYLEEEDRIKFEEGQFSITDSKYVEEFLEVSLEFLVHISFKLMEKLEDIESK